MFSSFVCNDIDQFAEWVNHIEWDLEATQLSCGANRIQFDYFAFPELSVAYHHMKQSVYDVFNVPFKSVIFVIGRSKHPAICNGIELLPSMLTILRPLHTYRVMLPCGWENYEFTLSEQLLERTGLLPPNLFEKTARLEEAFWPLSESATEHFLRRIDHFFQMARNRQGAIEDTISQTEFYDFILYGLQQLIDVSIAARHPQPIRRTRRADLVEKARDVMNANLKVELTAGDIAETLGVSSRVLNYAFQESLGFSPYQFFLIQKLHEVRRLLKSSDVSVIEASTSYGFCTPSRFTRQYKRLFGELPSKTKRDTMLN